MVAKRPAKIPPIDVVDGETRIAVQRDARSDLYSTFRVGGPADYLTRVGTADEIALAFRWAREQGLPVTVIGGGSNVLIADDGIRGLLILVRRPGKEAEAGLEVLEENADNVLVRVPAFAPSNWLGRTAAERGWAGLAWMIGLPGNVGGAIVNNAGAHGGETTDMLETFRVVTAEGEIIEHDRDWLEPAYRYTKLKVAPRPRDLVIVDGTFRFPLGDPAALRAEADEYGAYRDRTQPTGACGGSIFKNPLPQYSGAVIDQLGLKGTRIGGAVVSEKHANFIVNDEKGKAADIWALVQQVQAHVKDATGISLEPEIERIGAWT